MHIMPCSTATINGRTVARRHRIGIAHAAMDLQGWRLHLVAWIVFFLSTPDSLTVETMRGAA